MHLQIDIMRSRMLTLYMMHCIAYHVLYASSHQAGEIAATDNTDINAAIYLYCRASDTTYKSPVSVVLASSVA